MRSAPVALCAVVLGWAGRAEAADLFVDASAAAGGDGSQGAPFQQIQAGLSAAEPGDVLHVAPGSYDAIQTVRAGNEAGRA
jgi:hypothetical protein